MNIVPRSIAAAGDHSKERVTFRVEESVELGEYMLTRNEMIDDRVGLTILNAFWFPNQDIDANDLIVVYTRKGTSSSKEITKDRKAHFFFWGLEAPIWSDNRFTPVLLHAPKWIFKDPLLLKDNARPKGVR